MSIPKDKSEAKNPEELNKENINPEKAADLDKKSPGSPANEKDPHRGITDTPSQHEQLLPEEEREGDSNDDDDSALDEEFDDLDDIEEEQEER